MTSPLLDPILLESDVAKPVSGVFEKLGEMDWTNFIVNIILPFLGILAFAFYLKSCYDEKQEKLRELGLGG